MINNYDLKFRTNSTRDTSSPVLPVVISLLVDAPTSLGYLKYYVLFVGDGVQEYFWLESVCNYLII